jgi:toxin ParE1/3/4
MVELVWTEPALMDLNEVAEYIALDDPLAGSNYVKKVFKRVDRLELFPNSGKYPAELPDSPYREVVVPPCRIFYRIEDNYVYIVHVMRSERLLRSFLLERADRST